MYTSKIKDFYVKFRKERLCQGDILQNINFTLRVNGISDEEDKIELPYIVIMSQDCDVDLDYKKRKEEKGLLKTYSPEQNPEKFRPLHDKFLPTILVCPAYLSSSFITGSHIKSHVMKLHSQPEFDKIKKNNEMIRYHYLPQNTELGVTELVLDFKHFFTLPADIIYKQKKTSYVATINELFREGLSQRFGNYLSRFGLPFDPSRQIP